LAISKTEWAFGYRLLAVGCWAEQNQGQKQKQEQKQNQRAKTKAKIHHGDTEARRRKEGVCYHSCVPIREIYVSGYRSVRDLELKLRPINVLTVTNGETKIAG